MTTFSPTPPLPSDEVYDLVRTVLRLSRRFRQVLDEPLESSLGLNTKEVLVLGAVMDGCDSPGAVAARHSLPAPTVTRIITKLAAEGLIGRVPDASDLRRHRLTLTASGEATRLRFAGNARQIVDAHFGHLDAAQVRAAVEALHALAPGVYGNDIKPRPEVNAEVTA